jgi:mono/diheme cytochrome c family protein
MQRVVTLICVGFVGGVALAAEPSERELERAWSETVAPFVQTYCSACHGKEKREGKLDLTAFSSLNQATAGHATWETVRERLEAKEMPPEEAKKQPTPAERAAVVAWIGAVRAFEARRSAGDPGVVSARRLNSAEYNYTIRDLTGFDIRPTREFPIDPANEAGFDNSSQSLAMSPGLAKKYVGAARYVAEHLVLKPRGFDFAPHAVMTDTDRDKYCVNRIISFYQRQPTDWAAYFLAAWRFKHQVALGSRSESWEELAAAEGVSAKYLKMIWAAIMYEPDEVGPMAKLWSMWRALPEPDGKNDEAVRAGCVAMRDWVKQLRRKLEPSVKGLKIPGVHEGSQSFVLWKNRQYAANRQTYSRTVLQVGGAGEVDDPDLVVPADEEQRKRYEASFARFCSLFPDAFYVSERGRDYVGKPREQQEKGRLLSAGFHSQMGYFRDDGPLCELILDERQREELKELWRELDFIANVPLRQLQGFLLFERTDSRFMRDEVFDPFRAEDKDAGNEAKIARLTEVYLAKARDNGGGEVELQAIADYFREMSERSRRVEQARVAAEASHLESLVAFAERAYRRPMLAAEREDLLAFYRSVRSDSDVTHEEAMQDAVVYVLMSPQFCYRMDLAIAAGEAKRALSDYELANRLSYFLWSSMPDVQLLQRAAAGDLHRPDVLVAQVWRMLADERIRDLAVEFGGNWLDFRRFEQHNSVDRGRFPTFSNELRQAMFEEPVRFFIDLMQRDGSVLDFLYARHTYVNRVLAEHYDLPDLFLERDQWVRIDDAADHGRGGLLPMAVFLTQNAPGLRTSPVKRGYWVVRRVLGERIPPPPPNVPELPADEAKLDLSLRDALAKHREHASCAGCHERFDSLGLVFEGYGPIGERREVDLAGRVVDMRASFPGGSEGTGLDGLKSYLRQHRQNEFVENLSRKLLSYGLGRTLSPSDDALVATMQQKLGASDYRFGSLIETIVTSPQFLTKRGE